mmetsp:Transcript_66350/g.130729  ORF Transcript_66350/g.130729 Transcript_66350/m.130729 type:complete len:210 (+) Transcript_66350:77-706(+)
MEERRRTPMVAARSQKEVTEEHLVGQPLLISEVDKETASCRSTSSNSRSSTQPAVPSYSALCLFGHTSVVADLLFLYATFVRLVLVHLAPGSKRVAMALKVLRISWTFPMVALLAAVLGIFALPRSQLAPNGCEHFGKCRGCPMVAWILLFLGIVAFAFTFQMWNAADSYGEYGFIVVGLSFLKASMSLAFGAWWLKLYRNQTGSCCCL